MTLQKLTIILDLPAKQNAYCYQGEKEKKNVTNTLTLIADSGSTGQGKRRNQNLHLSMWFSHWLQLCWLFDLVVIPWDHSTDVCMHRNAVCSPKQQNKPVYIINTGLIVVFLTEELKSPYNIFIYSLAGKLLIFSLLFLYGVVAYIGTPKTYLAIGIGSETVFYSRTWRKWNLIQYRLWHPVSRNNFQYKTP